MCNELIFHPLNNLKDVFGSFLDGTHFRINTYVLTLLQLTYFTSVEKRLLPQFSGRQNKWCLGKLPLFSSVYLQPRGKVELVLCLIPSNCIFFWKHTTLPLGWAWPILLSFFCFCLSHHSLTITCTLSYHFLLLFSLINYF